MARTLKGLRPLGGQVLGEEELKYLRHRGWRRKQAWGQGVPLTPALLHQPRWHLPQHHGGGCLRHGCDGAELPGGAGCHQDHPARRQPQPRLQAAAVGVRRQRSPQGGTSLCHPCPAPWLSLPWVSEQGQMLRGLSFFPAPLAGRLGAALVNQHCILLLAPSPGPQAPEAEVWDIPFQ